MRITRLELDNFKSHEHTVVTFMPGTNAISGPNYAGKTSLVQSIALALFGFCEGRAADYIRRGASGGAQIRVTLVSGLNARAYEITRKINRAGTTTEWAVRDAEQGHVIANGAADMTAWLREHLKIGNFDVKNLFEEAVGVPQGQLVTAFLDTAGPRQKRFNVLLRIEEFDAACHNLGATERHSMQQITDREKRIAGLEGETREMSQKERQARELKTEYAKLEAEIKTLTAAIVDLTGREAIFAHAKTLLERQKQRVVRLEKWQGGRQERLKSRLEQRQKAEQAATQCETRLSGYKSYEDALTRQSLLTRQIQERDALTTQKTPWITNLAKAEAKAALQETALQVVANAEAKYARLEPLAASQAALETKIADTRQQAADTAAEYKVADAGRRNSQAGHCPFLREPCRNVAESGRTLVQFFDTRLIDLKSADEAAQKRLAVLQEELTTLNDPRAQRAAEHKMAQTRLAVEAALQDAQTQQRRCEQEIANIDRQCAPYVTLTDDYNGLAATLRRTEEDYKRYIAAAPIAALLSDCRAAEMSAASALARLERALTLRAKRRDSAAQGYDADAHRAVTTTREKADRQRAIAETSRDNNAKQAETLADELTILRAKSEELAQARQILADLQTNHRHLTAIRQALKQAGPRVNDVLVQRISRAAEQIFRALLDDPGVGLQWTTDYEIVLLRDGSERTLHAAAGSERVAAALAIRLALLQSLGELRFAFFDEPTIHLDDARRDKLARQLLTLPFFHQLFVISHDDAFQAHTDHVVRLTASEGLSRVAD